jgi:hypothetical protein
MTDDPKISQRYRDLPREEPPRALDDAILAAARRAAETRPAPLVVPSGRRRWYFPLAAAAVIVLAVAVTVHVERQQPDVEIAEAPLAAPPPLAPSVLEEQPAPAQVPKAGAKRELFTPDPKPAADARELRAKRDAEPPADLQKAQQAPTSPAPAPAASARAPAQDAVSGARESARADVAKPAAPMRQESSVRASSAPSAAPAAVGALGAFAYASPEQWLQGIDDLKRQGRHDEAEKQLAEFRKRYPDYRIPEAILEKFEKR